MPGNYNDDEARLTALEQAVAYLQYRVGKLESLVGMLQQQLGTTQMTLGGLGGGGGGGGLVFYMTGSGGVPACTGSGSIYTPGSATAYLCNFDGTHLNVTTTVGTLWNSMTGTNGAVGANKLVQCTPDAVSNPWVTGEPCP